MSLSSMTGFARTDGVCRSYIWAWELKSVNAKGLEFRLRVPPGWEPIEAPVRVLVTKKLSRGTVYAALALRREGVAPAVRINEPVLAAILAAIRKVSHQIDAAPPTLDGILALKGVIDVIENEESEEDRRGVEAVIVEGFNKALDGLVGMRGHEGKALENILSAKIGEIEALTKRAEMAPGRRPEAIRARLAEQVAALSDISERFDADRLHQEAILIATRVDVREELDRLSAHVAQARHLLAHGGAVGRRLDFLAQEFNREANTLCSKSNDVELTTIGLELKSVVEQFREQVQNLE